MTTTALTPWISFTVLRNTRQLSLSLSVSGHVAPPKKERYWCEMWEIEALVDFKSLLLSFVTLSRTLTGWSPKIMEVSRGVRRQRSNAHIRSSSSRSPTPRVSAFSFSFSRQRATTTLLFRIFGGRERRRTDREEKSGNTRGLGRNRRAGVRVGRGRGRIGRGGRIEGVGKDSRKFLDHQRQLRSEMRRDANERRGSRDNEASLMGE